MDTLTSVSTTTQLALNPPTPKPKHVKKVTKARKSPAVSEVKVSESKVSHSADDSRTVISKITQRRHTAKEIELLLENVEIGKQLASSLNKQIATLEAENDRLREFCNENNVCNVILYSSQNDLTLASVTNASEEGVHVFARVSELFQRNKNDLHKKGIGFAILQDVPINHIYATPFPSLHL